MAQSCVIQFLMMAKNKTLQVNYKQVTLIGTIIFFIGGFLWFYTQFENHFIFYPYIDTIFAKDFSVEKFNLIKKGMAESEVSAILGEPRYINTKIAPYEACWSYSGDGKVSPYADFSWYHYSVCFNDGKVSVKGVEEFFN